MEYNKNTEWDVTLLGKPVHSIAAELHDGQHQHWSWESARKSQFKHLDVTLIRKDILSIVLF